jgi:protease IV
MRDFFKQTLSTLLALCIFAGVSVGGLVAIAITIAASSAKDSGPRVQARSVLTIDMNQAVIDAEPEVSPLELVRNGAPNVLNLRTAIRAIDEAAKDNKIVAIYLANRNTGNRGGTGYANLKEMREALGRFKQAGKKIYAYDVDWQEKEYYLASIADEIGINPMGNLEFNGLSSETAFYGSALQKYGVGVQAIWRGKYKSAVEPFLRAKRSDASREQTKNLLDDLWQEFISTVADGRQLSPDSLKKLSETKGNMTAKEAKDAKLIDRIIYVDEILDELKKLTGEDRDSKSFKQITLKSYTEAVAQKINSTKGSKVAVVYADGEIVDGQGAPSQVGGDRLARQLRKLRQDPDTKAVVLRVNSPGGSATASDVIQREMILTRKQKPVVVSMGSTAASGGYWISTYANKIFAEPNTVTGSIGVFGLQPNIQKIANDNGVNWDVVKTGKFADSMTVYRPKTAEEIANIQTVIGVIYDQFLTKVSESRKLDRAKVSEIAQGRVWSGREAKKLGLVDEMGGLGTAITTAAKLANLGDDWHVSEASGGGSFEERILRSLFGNTQILAKTEPEPTDRFTQEFQIFQADLNSLRLMNDPQGIYMRMPENLRIH